MDGIGTAGTRVLILSLLAVMAGFLLVGPSPSAGPAFEKPVAAPDPSPGAATPQWRVLLPGPARRLFRDGWRRGDPSPAAMVPLVVGESVVPGLVGPSTAD